jgi:hypothetical protein
MPHIFTDQEDSTEITPLVTVIGIISMILSIIGNLKQMEEMYPLFLQSARLNEKLNTTVGYFREIPFSLFITCLSDFTLLLYGIYIRDIIIVIYGFLNSFLVILVVIAIQFTIAENNEMISALRIKSKTSNSKTNMFD